MIVHQFFGLQAKNEKDAKVGFQNQLNMFFCMIISCTSAYI
jgi:hypothetical protein